MFLFLFFDLLKFQQLEAFGKFHFKNTYLSKFLPLPGKPCFGLVCFVFSLDQFWEVHMEWNIPNSEIPFIFSCLNSCNWTVHQAEDIRKTGSHNRVGGGEDICSLYHKHCQHAIDTSRFLFQNPLKNILCGVPARWNLLLGLGKFGNLFSFCSLFVIFLVFTTRVKCAQISCAIPTYVPWLHTGCIITLLYCMSSAGTARGRSPAPPESLGATRVPSRWAAVFLPLNL